MAPNAWGQELSPIENIVSRKAEYPRVLRSYSRWIGPISDLPCREVEITHGFYAIIRFRRIPKYSILENYLRFVWDLDIQIQWVLAIIFGFFAIFTQSGARILQYSPVTSVWDAVLRKQQGDSKRVDPRSGLGDFVCPTVAGLGAGGVYSEISRLLLRISCRISWTRRNFDWSRIWEVIRGKMFVDWKITRKNCVLVKQLLKPCRPRLVETFSISQAAIRYSVCPRTDRKSTRLNSSHQR